MRLNFSLPGWFTVHRLRLLEHFDEVVIAALLGDKFVETTIFNTYSMGDDRLVGLMVSMSDY